MLGGGSGSSERKVKTPQNEHECSFSGFVRSVGWWWLPGEGRTSKTEREHLFLGVVGAAVAGVASKNEHNCSSQREVEAGVCAQFRGVVGVVGGGGSGQKWHKPRK